MPAERRRLVAAALWGVRAFFRKSAAGLRRSATRLWRRSRPWLRTLAWQAARLGGWAAALPEAAWRWVRRACQARRSRPPPPPLSGVDLDATLGRADDLATLRATLHRSAGETVVLRVPRGNAALASPLGMRLLRQQVDAKRLLLVIESGDRELRQLARQYGLTAVPSLRGRRIEGGRLRPRSIRWGGLQVPLPLLRAAGRALLLGLVSGAALSALIVLAPSARVRVAPELVALRLPVAVVAQVVDGDQPLPPFVVPAQRYETQVTVNDALEATGVVDTPVGAVPGPAQADIDRLRETNLFLLEARGLEQLQARAGLALYPASLAVRLEEEQFRPTVGEAGEVVEMTAVATVSVLGVELRDLRAWAASAIAAQRGPELEVVEESLLLSPLGSVRYDAASETLRFDMMVDGFLAAAVPEDAVKRAIRFQSPGAAEAALNDRFDLRAPARVDVRPGFMPFVAPFGFRIAVEVDRGGPAAAGPG